MSQQVQKQSAGLAELIQRENVQARFEGVLGANAKTFISSLMSVVRSNNRLAEAEPSTIISAAMIAATLDLPVNPALGMAHIVPYKDNNRKIYVAQFQVGWKGLIQLALRTNQYKTIHATEVYEGQFQGKNSFTGEYKFQEHRDSDEVVGYLLYFRLLAGYEKYYYMTRQEMVDHAMEYSASYRNKYTTSSWVTNFDAMGLKTVIRLGLSKFGLLTTELQKAIEHDQGTIIDGKIEYVDNADDMDGLSDTAKQNKLKQRIERDRLEWEALEAKRKKALEEAAGRGNESANSQSA